MTNSDNNVQVGISVHITERNMAEYEEPMEVFLDRLIQESIEREQETDEKNKKTN